MPRNVRKELNFCEKHPLCEAVKKNDFHTLTPKLDQYYETIKSDLWRGGWVHEATVLHCAATHGNDQAVAYLLGKYPKLLDTKNLDKRTALHCAALWGHERVVAQLVSARPALIDACTESNCTALHYAASEGREAVVAQLLAANPNSIKALDNQGWTALHFAVDGGHEGVASQLLAADPSLAEVACRDTWPANHLTALHFAANQGHTGLVKILMNANPAVASETDRCTQTPLHHAVMKGHGEVVRTMLAMQPELLHDIDCSKSNVLHLAIENKKPIEFVEEVWKLNPDFLFSANKKGLTPFDFAVMNDHQAAIDLLLGSLTFEEVMSSYGRCNREYSWFGDAPRFPVEWLRPVLEGQCEALSLLLLPDVVGIVFEFLDFERVKRPQHKRLKQ